MTRQPDLFDYPNRPGYVQDSDTSRAAADSLSDRELSKQKLAIVGYIDRNAEHGATCDEIEVAFDLRHQTASARIRELSLSGVLVDTGRRRTTRSGRLARVYVIAEAA
jgi:hypothetical protein